MASIRSRGNKSTEGRLLELFRAYRVTGWRRNLRLFGKPDFAFKGSRTVVFVDGCFWHGCPRCFKAPTSNALYWEDKIARNKARDRAVNRQLTKNGWIVVRVWEHSLKRPTQVIQRVLRALEQ